MLAILLNLSSLTLSLFLSLSLSLYLSVSFSLFLHTFPVPFFLFSKVLVIEPEVDGGAGKILRTLTTPSASYPTSVAFGGSDNSDVFVTSSSIFYDVGGTNSGSLFHARSEVGGVAMRAFDERYLPEWVNGGQERSSSGGRWCIVAGCAIAVAMGGIFF